MTLRQTSRRSGVGSGKSSLVTIAFTPGSLSAARTSMDRMRACAWGLRSTLPTSIPGMVASAPKRARPVTLSMPSGRAGRVPMTLNLRTSVDVLSSGISGSSHFLGGGHDRTHDLVVTGAAAKIAGKPEADFVFARLLVLLQQFARGHQHARRADAALQCRMLDELLLQGMQLLALGHAFDGLDLAALGLRSQHEAGADESAIEHDTACPAIAGAAALFAAGQPET